MKKRVSGELPCPATSLIDIGIKHDFLCINICWVLREMLKPEPEMQEFQHLLRGPVDVNVSEKLV